MNSNHQRKLFAVNKNQIRQLLGRGDGLPMPPSTWRRWWRDHQIHEKLQMSETEFSKAQWFYLERYEALKAVIGFDEGDLAEL